MQKEYNYIKTMEKIGKQRRIGKVIDQNQIDSFLTRQMTERQANPNNKRSLTTIQKMMTQMSQDDLSSEGSDLDSRLANIDIPLILPRTEQSEDSQTEQSMIQQSQERLITQVSQAPSLPAGFKPNWFKNRAASKETNKISFENSITSQKTTIARVITSPKINANAVQTQRMKTRKNTSKQSKLPLILPQICKQPSIKNLQSRVRVSSKMKKNDGTASYKSNNVGSAKFSGRMPSRQLMDQLAFNGLKINAGL